MEHGRRMPGFSRVGGQLDYGRVPLLFAYALKAIGFIKIGQGKRSFGKSAAHGPSVSIGRGFIFAVVFGAAALFIKSLRIRSRRFA